ncbi:MAG: YggS family pyridoxal phosphate-dependent enzyme [Bryobacteraceae bacterium]
MGLVEERIRTTAARVGRSPKEITLLAVTKVFPASAILEAYELGLREFGENYVQEFAGKYPEVRDLPGIRFHFIGHLQSNKAAAAAELFHSIQTIDNERLAKRLNATNRSLDVMAEVKLSPEETKHGVEPAQLPPLLDAIRALPNLNLVGLMTMPPWSDTAEDSRTYFRRLKELAGQHGLPCLSMGMSHDLEVAIEEGATHVRVGTALFGSRKAFLNR